MSAKDKLKKKIREEATSRQASETQERQTAIRARLEKARANLASGVGLENDAVIGRHVAPSTIVTGHIAGQAVETSKLADVAATTAKIGGLSVTTEKLDNLSVITAKINNGAVDTARIAGSAVTTEKINNLSVITDKIDNAAVDTARIAPSAVVTDRINNNAVIGAKIDGLAVDSGKLGNLAVVTDKINNNAVIGAKIDALAVDSGKIAAAAITTEKINNNAVTNPKIETGAVTGAKIDDSLNNPGQGIYGLRTIGAFLGGTSQQASASDHSHGSGNSTDFDLLPAAHQDRILLARSRVRSNIRNIPLLTRDQLNLYLRELSIVALAGLALEIDAPDMRAEERRAKRKAGESLPLFSEWRMGEGQTLHDPTHPSYVEGLPEEGTVPE